MNQMLSVSGGGGTPCGSQRSGRCFVDSKIRFSNSICLPASLVPALTHLCHVLLFSLKKASF